MRDRVYKCAKRFSRTAYQEIVQLGTQNEENTYLAMKTLRASRVQPIWAPFVCMTLPCAVSKNGKIEGPP